MPLSQQNAQQASAKCPPVGYLVFDIETDGLFVDDVPPPVLCAATLEVQRAGTNHEAVISLNQVISQTSPTNFQTAKGK